jgi:hypothetical protein
MSEFVVKDSGARQEFKGGMVRDTTEGKIDWHRTADGPMLRRWADHLTKGNKKYPDVKPGVPNWTLAAGEEEYQRFRQSAYRHFMDWYNGKRDEDHGAAVFFNINGAEATLAKMSPLQPVRDGVQYRVRDMEGAVVSRVAPVDVAPPLGPESAAAETEAPAAALKQPCRDAWMLSREYSPLCPACRAANP